MRHVFHVFPAALIVAALFCGNCLSCPQVLLALSGHQPGHSCCHHPPVKMDCHSQVLSQFVKAEGADVTPVFDMMGVAPVVAAAAVLPRAVLATWCAADAVPPDFLSLQSLLRV